MLTEFFMDSNVPRLELQDSIERALQLISNLNFTHYPVVSDDKYAGMVSMDSLMAQTDHKLPVESLKAHFLQIQVRDNLHFLNAVKIITQFETNALPVINEVGELSGVITSSTLMKALANFSGANETGGVIVLEMDKIQFSISEISRIVESDDCTILHLNSDTNPLTGKLSVTLHVNKKEIHAIVATFRRYQYDVVYQYGDELIAEEINNNYQNLMNYLYI